MPRYREYKQHMMSRLTIFLGCAVLCLGNWPLPSQAAPYPEDAVKAIFLYRFAGYVAWPAAARATPHFTIAVAGDDQVVDELTEFLPTHPVGDQPALVRRITGPSEVGDAQIVFIGNDYHGNVRSFVQSLAGRPVLVVTDRPGALSSGSTVNFLLIDQHVRFEISLSAAARAGLKMSAQLLAVANHVNTGWLEPLPGCTRRRAPGTAGRCAALAALQ